MSNKHVTVLAEEAVEALGIKKGKWYIDATFGRGGHTKRLLSKGAKVIAFDWDEEAIEHGKEEFSQAIDDGSLYLVRESFSKIGSVVRDLQKQESAGEIEGVLFDFGTSTEQLTSSDRGFSFEGTGPLDMRMDNRLGVTAADILVAVPESQLADMFYVYGGEEQSKRIAKAIKKSKTPITTVEQLSQLVSSVKGGRRSRLHPATKVFQALRIAVNSELDEILRALPQALELTRSKGKIVTIAFHEGEDRIAKHTFRTWEEDNLGETTELVTPSRDEVKENPRSRSAKMRVFRKN